MAQHNENPESPLISHGRLSAGSMTKESPPRTRKRRHLPRTRRARHASGSEESDHLENVPSEYSLSPGSSRNSDTMSIDEDDAPVDLDDTQHASPRKFHQRWSSSSSRSSIKRSVLDNNPAPLLQNAATSWSDMVQEQLLADAEELPVLEFAEFTINENGHAAQQQKPTPGSLADKRIPAVAGRPQLRQSARQEYQRRLNEDPSYVPVVGEFWGHDDRLMDKKLRSLSGWWRGRWFNRGRNVFHRGGGLRDRRFSQIVGRDNSEDRNNSVSPQELPPIERTWGHEGYEELSRRDRAQTAGKAKMTRRDRMSLSPKPKPHIGSRAVRGPDHLSFAHTSHTQAQALAEGRPWYTRKPEKVWTKQAEGFLYVDPELQPHRDIGQGIQIVLPRQRKSLSGKLVVRLQAATEMRNKTRLEQVTGKDLELGPSCTVRLPTGSKQRTYSTHDIDSPAIQEPVTTVADPPLDITSGPRPDSDQSNEVRKLDSPNMHLQRDADVEDRTLQEDADASLLMGREALITPASQSVPVHYLPASAYGTGYGFHGLLSGGFVYGEGSYPVDPNSGRGVAISHLYPPQQMLHPILPQDVLPYGHVAPDYISPGFHEPPVHFSLPRQSSRIEIRAPKGNEPHDESSGTRRASSSLRENVTAESFQPSSTGMVYPAHQQPALEVPPPMVYHGMQFYLPPYNYGQYMDPNQTYEGYGETGVYYQ